MRLPWHPARLLTQSRFLSKFISRRLLQAQVAFWLALVLLTAALGHRFYNAPRLDVGRESPQTLYAPESVVVEDLRATEEKRKLARKDATSIWIANPETNEAVLRNLRGLLDQGSQIRQITSDFPFANTSVLSTTSQIYLRQAPDEEWHKLQRIATLGNVLPPRQSLDNDLTPEQQRILSELANYRRTEGLTKLYDLLQVISQARQNYELAVSAPVVLEGDRGAALTGAMLNLSDQDWQQMQVRLQRITQRMLAQGITPGLDRETLESAIRLNVRDEVPRSVEPLATQLLAAVLQPNLMRDEEKSRQAADKAAQQIPPVTVAARRGEPIIRSGQVIGSGEFALLDHFGMSRRGIDWLGLAGFGGLVGAAIGAYAFVVWRFRLPQRQRDQVLLVLLALSTPMAMLLRLPPTNLPAVGLLVGTFYGAPLGIAVPLLLAILLPIGMTVPGASLVSSALAGILCGFLGSRVRSREELAWLGAAAAILQGVVYLVLNLLASEALSKLPANAAMHSLMGLAWCIVAIGISPYLEQVFDLATTIRLVELANPNCRLLKRLVSEAPGTFQHTLFVATLAEAAARALGCNVELVRTGTLYHDIGKMHDPQGFIENQMGGVNKHDEIDDPWKSAEIIKKHVTEGLVMARKCRLPSAVQAFIPEHQGTMLIAYFYHQAQQRVAQNPGHLNLPPLRESDFRYDGPAPRTRETGIVMLADSCEAALRSLNDGTCDEAMNMINKILKARWQDHQLANSGLTREDLSKIATIFVDVWKQFNHRRIAYPKLAAPAPMPAVGEPVR